MTTIEAIIERAKDGTFSVYCKDQIFSGAGETIKEAKANMMEQMAFYKQAAKEEGFQYPAFLDGEFKVSYTLDAQSLLKYYIGAGIFSLAGLEKVTGINQKQLWAYLNGTKPRKAQKERIVSGFESLKNDFNALFA